jgi:hypothetical protein
MKKLLFILILLAGCAKQPIDTERQVQLSVEGIGTYSITYGTSDCVTVSSEDKWSSVFSAYPGDTIQLSVKTSDSPATIYLGVEEKEGLLFIKSLYVNSQSMGTLNYIVKP